MSQNNSAKLNKANVVPMNKGRKMGGPPGFIREKVEIKNTKQTLAKIWTYLAKEKKNLILTTLLILITISSSLSAPVFIANAIDKFIAKGDMAGLTKTSILLLGIYLVGATSTWFQSYIMIGVSQRTVALMRKELFEKIQTLPLSYLDSKDKGDLMSRLTNDIDNITNTLNESIIQFISSALTVSGSAILMFIVNWQLACIAILTIPLVLFIVKNIVKLSGKYFREQQAQLGGINSIIEEKISGQKVIKTYVREKEVINEFIKTNEELKAASIKAQVYSGFMGPTMNFTNNLRFAIIVSFGAWFSVIGIASIGTIAAFINYSRQFGRPINQLAQLYNSIQSAIAGAERVFEVMAEKSEFSHEDNRKDVKNLEGLVEFEDVNFSYVKGNPILKNINFKASKGETIALVGPTGAGKTTIINLLTRFYEIDSGTIKLDGIDINDITKKSLRKRLGIVLQDTYLFSDTVRENIRFGKLSASDEEVERVAKLANAHHFIEKLPNGYDTVLAEEGNNLSQGQRQLLSIARAILADHDILILDEATSNVDTRTEAHIQEALLNLMEGKTSFIIAHRLSTIRDADNIMVIKDGEIIESGNHHALLGESGFYHNLYNSQFKKKI